MHGPKRYSFFLLLVFLFLVGRAGAQLSEPFNRFQYHSFQWQVLRAPSHHVYYPRSYDSLGFFIVHAYDSISSRLQRTMGSGPGRPPAVIIYPAVTQLYESNVGSTEPDALPFPTFIKRDSRLLLAYDGSYRRLEDQLKLGLARIIWEAQLAAGVALQLPMKSSVPLWFAEGAIRYFALGWRIADEDVLRASWAQQSQESWNQVIATDQKLAGQAYCYYLNEAYGVTAVKSIFEQLKVGKSLTRAIRLVTKKTLDVSQSECLLFYRQRFGAQKEEAGQQRLAIKWKSQNNVSKIMLSPDKHYLAWQAEAFHKRRLYLHDINHNKTRLVATYNLPPWLADHSTDPYPLIAWAGQQLATIQPRKGKLELALYDRNGKRKTRHTLTGADGVTSLQAAGAGNYLLAAFRRGQSDIVNFNALRDQWKPYMSDPWDDANGILDAQGVVYFSSERPLPEKSDTGTIWQGIFFKKDKSLGILVADTLSDQYWQPLALFAKGDLLAIQTRNGAAQFTIVPAAGAGASREQLPPVGFFRPFQYLPGTDEMVFLAAEADSLIAQMQPAAAWQKQNKADTALPWLRHMQQRRHTQLREDSVLHAARDTTVALSGQILTGSLSHVARTQAATRPQSVPYVLQLYSAYFSAAINNDYYINRYQPYQHYQGLFKVPEIGGMAKAGFSDLLENHHFAVAYRLPAVTEGSDFLVRYRNTAKKLDWSLAYFRKVESLKPDALRDWRNEQGAPYPNLAKVKTHYYELGLHRPLRYDAGIDVTLAVRKDKTIFQATETYSLDFPALENLWMIASFSGAINRMQPTLPALYKGYRLHLTFDGFKGFAGSELLTVGASIKAQVQYPLYKYITLDVNARLGSSAGSQYLLYTVGGVDNNITPRVDSTVHLSQHLPVSFQTLITPLRGYEQYAIYGTSYGLLNTDLYFPLFQTLVPVTTSFQALNQLQLGVFADLAGADKRLRQHQLDWLLSYGASARTTLAGYPLRVEVGWPVKGGQPVWYLSLKL